jgi:hypothetical protein
MADRIQILFLGAAAAAFCFCCLYMILHSPLWLALAIQIVWISRAISLYRHCECGKEKPQR